MYMCMYMYMCMSLNHARRPRLPRAPSSTMQKGATDRHPHSRGAASYGHGGPWLHALPPCCKGTQVELEPNRRPEAWLQAMSPTTTTEGGKPA
jgi:hypothetical protein